MAFFSAKPSVRFSFTLSLHSFLLILSLLSASLFFNSAICIAGGHARVYAGFYGGDRGFRHDPFFNRPFFYGPGYMPAHNFDRQFMYDLHYHTTAGRWLRTWYGDRFGWWWNVGNNWYLYDQPVYPYPVASPMYAVIGQPVYSTTTVIAPQNAVGTTEITTGKVLIPPSPNQPAVKIENTAVIPASSGTVRQSEPDQIWYYCNEPQGYYPYVSACPSGWIKTPAKPQDAN